mgnify:CR=1 FL=1
MAPSIVEILEEIDIGDDQAKRRLFYPRFRYQFFERLIKRYEGTYLGQQELEGLLITDRPGALWSRSVLDTHRVQAAPEVLTRVVVAIDPPATASEDSSEAGIIVVGQAADGCAYVLADGSLHGSPDAWGRQAVRLYDQFSADQIVGEVNNGGDTNRNNC